MEWTKIIGLCLLAASLVMVLRQMNPQAAMLLTVAFGVIVAGAVLPELAEDVRRLEGFLASLNLASDYFTVMLRAMGVALTTQLAVQVCQEMDAPQIASKAELAGRLAMIGIVLPVFMEITESAVGILR